MKNKTKKTLTSPLFYLCTLALTGCNAIGNSRMVKSNQEDLPSEIFNKQEDLPSGSNLFPNRICANANISEVSQQIGKIAAQLSSLDPNDVKLIIDKTNLTIMELGHVLQAINRIEDLNTINAINSLTTATRTALNAIKTACQADNNIASNPSMRTKIKESIDQANKIIDNDVLGIDPSSEIALAIKNTIGEIETLIMDQNCSTFEVFTCLCYCC